MVVDKRWVIDELIKMLEQVDEENEEYLEEQSTEDHLKKAIRKSGWEIDEKNKVIRIWCRSNTEFTREIYEDSLILKIDGWIIEYEEAHGSGLVCPGYCGVFSEFLKKLAQTF